MGERFAGSTIHAVPLRECKGFSNDRTCMYVHTEREGREAVSWCRLQGGDGHAVHVAHHASRPECVHRCKLATLSPASDPATWRRGTPNQLWTTHPSFFAILVLVIAAVSSVGLPGRKTRKPLAALRYTPPRSRRLRRRAQTETRPTKSKGFPIRKRSLIWVGFSVCMPRKGPSPPRQHASADHLRTFLGCLSHRNTGPCPLRDPTQTSVLGPKGGCKRTAKLGLAQVEHGATDSPPIRNQNVRKCIT